MVAETTFEPILTKSEKGELRGQIFRERVLVGLDLSGADLRGARFEHTLIERCNFARADLRGAYFVFCDLRRVVLTHAQLGENRFYGTTLSKINGLNEEDRVRIQKEGGMFQPQSRLP